MRDFRLAKATKPSHLSTNAEQRLLLLSKINRILSSIGVRKHFIDAEWASTDPMPSDLQPILEEQRNVTLVATISVRRSDAERRVNEFVRIVQSYTNLQPCLVPGNPAYLSQHELCKNPIRLIEAYARAIRRVYDGTMYLGCENIERASARIAGLFNMTLFHVYRRSMLEAFLSLPSEGGTAIYTPVVVDAINDMVKSYVARRGMVNDPGDCLPKHVIDEYVLSLSDEGFRVLDYLRRRRALLVVQPFTDSTLAIRKIFIKIRRLANEEGVT
ncbi:MAG: hypothetical protein B9J98_03420 [Candidatus Terraquivivens tikiterensis]|uniref:Uncharacterized protein n=1 Tax=Candidatus Terraquivivens tikiterensis TaxID=1980982 RepID=A0A2R7Y5X8_9ARCH|nr:MAG: hypothetical protein B9J98_03420 [Candidatus Terraquivivens tikiterensis]